MSARTDTLAALIQYMNAKQTSDEPLIQLRRLCQPATRSGLQDDAELLSLYVEADDRLAMETLINRYSPMVASVCRCTVMDSAAAEDAFQATFFILLKSARKIRRHASVAAWLHGVAYRTACRMRQQRRAQQTSTDSCDNVVTFSSFDTDPVTQLARKMVLEALDRELQSLPEHLRCPLVEHYMLGYTAPQIAERMELSVSAVEGRLRRGRRVLRSRLAQRGISLSVLVAGSSWFQQHLQAADAAVWSERFLNQYVQQSDAPIDGSSNPEVSSLVRGELNMFAISTLVKVGLVVMGVVLVGSVLALSKTGAGFAGSGSGTGEALDFTAETAESSILAQMGMGSTAEGSTDLLDAEAAPWLTPEDAELPSWLAGGQSSMEAMENNRQRLSLPMSWDYSGNPLDQVLAVLSDEMQMQFVPDEMELALVGVDPDVPITSQGAGTVRECLRRILPPELTYVVRESCIEITSVDAERLPENLNMRFYDLSYVLPNAANAHSLRIAIEQSIDPDNWQGQGGTATIQHVGSLLVVSAPDSTHQKIEILLVNIRKMNPKNLEKSWSPY